MDIKQERYDSIDSLGKCDSVISSRSEKAVDPITLSLEFATRIITHCRCLIDHLLCVGSSLVNQGSHLSPTSDLFKASRYLL